MKTKPGKWYKKPNPIILYYSSSLVAVKILEDKTVGFFFDRKRIFSAIAIYASQTSLESPIIFFEKNIKRYDNFEFHDITEVLDEAEASVFEKKLQDCILESKKEEEKAEQLVRQRNQQLWDALKR